MKTRALTWLEFTASDGHQYVWSQIALPDPAAYYGGFKDPRVLRWGTIIRALSEARSGVFEGTTITVELSDTDRLLRRLLAEEATRYFPNRPVLVRVISDEGRRAGAAPYTVMRGLVASYKPESQLRFSLTAEDFLSRTFAGHELGLRIPQREVTLEDFPNANASVASFEEGGGAAVEVDALGKAVPVIYGVISDQQLTDTYQQLLPPTDPDPTFVQPGQHATDLGGQGTLNGGIGAYVLPFRAGQLGRLTRLQAITVGYNRALSIRWDAVAGAESYYVYVFDHGGWQPGRPKQPGQTFARMIVHDNTTQAFAGQARPFQQIVYTASDIVPSGPGWTDMLSGAVLHVDDTGRGAMRPIYVGDRVMVGPFTVEHTGPPNGNHPTGVYGSAGTPAACAAQTFSPPTGLLTSVALLLAKSGNPLDNVYVRVHALHPVSGVSGPVLATSAKVLMTGLPLYSAAPAPAGSGWGWMTFTLPTPLALTAGTTYALQVYLDRTVNDSVNVLNLATSTTAVGTGGTYPGGVAYTNPTGASTVKQADMDYCFRLSMTGDVTWRTALVCGHAIKRLLAGYVNDRLIDLETDAEWLTPNQPLAWAAAGFTTPYTDINGHRYTLIYLRGLAGDLLAGAVQPAYGSPGVTLNLEGIETVGDGTGEVLSDVHFQYLHCLVNWVLQSYESGPWLTVPRFEDAENVAQVDVASFARASEIAHVRIRRAVDSGVVTLRAPFPAQPVLDDFNRPNEQPLSSNGQWRTSPGVVPLALVGNDVVPTGPLSSVNGMYWWRRLAADFEAYVTVSVLPVAPPVTIVLYCATSSPAVSTTPDGFKLVLEWNKLTLQKIVGGIAQPLITYTPIVGGFTSGDAIGVQRVGSTFTVYIRRGGVWTQRGPAVVMPDLYKPVYLLATTVQQATVVHLDDVGGGPFVDPPPPDPTLSGGYHGAGIIGVHGEHWAVRDLVQEWNQCADVNSGFNQFGQFFVSMIDDAMAIDQLPLVGDVEDVIQDSFDIRDDLTSHFNVLGYSYARDYAGRSDRMTRRREVFDLDSINHYRAALVAPGQLFELVRQEQTATDIMQRRLLRLKDPPRIAQFSVPLTKASNYELGQVLAVTHYAGIGLNGWVEQPVRVIRHELDLSDLTVTLDCVDLLPLFGSGFILGDQVTLTATWPPAPLKDRKFGYLGVEGPDIFTTGEPAKRVR